MTIGGGGLGNRMSSESEKILAIWQRERTHTEVLDKLKGFVNIVFFFWVSRDAVLTFFSQMALDKR